MRLWIVLIMSMVAFQGVDTIASAQGNPIPASIHAGDCGNIGVEVATLTESTLATGQEIGSSEAVPATSSFSSVVVGIDSLTATEHVIAVPDASADQVLACGEVGGRLTGDGALIIGLREVGNSGFSGVAYLSPGDDPSLTNISLFMAGDQLGAQTTELEVKESQISVEQPQSVENSAPSVTIDDAAYASEVLRITQVMTQSFEDLSDLMSSPNFGDTEWTLNVATQFAIWQVSYQDALVLTPTPAFDEIHGLFVESLRLYSEAGDEAASGIDNFDINQINSAAAKMADANVLLNEAARLANELAGQIDNP